MTDTYATKDEIAHATKLLRNAEATPVIALTSEHALRGGAAADAWQRVYDYVEEIALEHGLLENVGRYGLDLNTGEFVNV